MDAIHVQVQYLQVVGIFFDIDRYWYYDIIQDFLRDLHVVLGVCDNNLIISLSFPFTGCGSDINDGQWWDNPLQ